MSDAARICTIETLPEATVVTFHIRSLLRPHDLDAAAAALRALDGKTILDLSAVDYLSSALLGSIFRLRQRLRSAGYSFRPPCGKNKMVMIVPTREVALEAMRTGAADPLILCGVSDDMMTLFVLC